MPYRDKEKQRAWFRKRYKIIKQKLDEYKLTIGCVDCGYKQNVAALEFDHLPIFIKNFNVSKVAGRGMNKVLEELVKCEVVCANCHAIRTNKRYKALSNKG